MRWLKRLVIALILALVLAGGLLFALQNATEVPVDLLVYQTAARPVAIWLLVAFAVGGVIGMVIGSLALVRLQASRTRIRRQLDACEKELAQLKTLPGKSAPAQTIPAQSMPVRI